MVLLNDSQIARGEHWVVMVSGGKLLLAWCWKVQRGVCCAALPSNKTRAEAVCGLQSTLSLHRSYQSSSPCSYK